MQHRSILRLPKWFCLMSIFVFSLLQTIPAQSAAIKKVRGRKVSISLEGESANRGDIFSAYDDRGKKRGYVRIMKVKGSRAIGVVTRGKARQGWTLRPRGKSSARRGARRSRKGRNYSPPKKKASYSGGILAGIDQASLTVTLNDGTSQVPLSGSSSGFGVLLDIPMSETLSIRAMAGQTKFDATGETENQECSDNLCILSISYLSASVLLRYHLTSGNFGVWFGGGGALLNPGSAESNAIDVETIKLSSAIVVGGGIDYWINNTMYIPLQATYNMLPSSDTVVSPKFISLRGGIAFQF